MAFYDQSQERLIEGTVARFDWVNPHMYLYIETESPDGDTVVIQGEGLGITQALVDGLDRDALKPGMPIVVRANPNRGGFGKQIRVLDVTTEDGEIQWTQSPRYPRFRFPVFEQDRIARFSSLQPISGKHVKAGHRAGRAGRSGTTGHHTGRSGDWFAQDSSPRQE
jgi:hypothetical protein